MKRVSKVIGMALLASFILTGCQQAPSIVGTWTADIAGGVSGEFNFSADNKLTTTASVKQFNLEFVTVSDYTVEGDVVKWTIKDAKVSGNPIATAEVESQLKKSVGQVIEVKTKFNGNDQLEITPVSGPAELLGGDKKMILNRKK
jgi:hypothetical protein